MFLARLQAKKRSKPLLIWIKEALLFIAIFASQTSVASAQNEFTLWGDTKDVFKYFYRGSIEQFQTPSNLYWLGASIPFNWYAFHEDERVTYHLMTKKMDGPTKALEPLGTLLTFPVLPLSLWLIGKWKNDVQLRQFAKEYTAALYIGLVESGILSFIPIHERPRNDDLTFWETHFRGDSSWPSGHLIPFTTLIFKTYQFYGPYWSIIPVGMTYLAARQRVITGKHWFSDVVASLFISAFASEGVRKVAAHKKNHPIYKWMFEHEAKVSIIRYHTAVGPRISWSF